MMKTLLAAAAAFALLTAAPAYACQDCKDCPHHKMAAADEKGEKVACPCGDGKECRCEAKCECPHCRAKKAEKKEEPKKS